MDFLTAQKQFSQQNRAKVTQLCSSQPGLGPETAEFLGCRLHWVILATQGSFSWIKKISADSQGRNPTWLFEHSVWSMSSQDRAPRARLKARLNPTAAFLCPRTQGTAWHRPRHQSHKRRVLVTPPATHFQKEKTELYPQGLKVLSGEGCAVAIEGQQPLNTPEVSICCLDVFLSRKKAERSGAGLSQSFKTTAGNSPSKRAVLSLTAPRRPSLHL